MKILYIYKDYFQRRKQYGKIMRKFGHDVFFLKKKHKRDVNSISIKEIKECNPDLIWFLSPWYVKYNPIVMDYIHSKKIPITFYHGVSSRFPYTDWLDIWKQFTIIFSTMRKFCEYLKKNNIDSYFIPFGFYPNQYFKCVQQKKYNISFAGTIDKKVSPTKDDRCIYINSLKNIKKVVAHGISFKKKLHKNISVIQCKSHAEQREAYAQSKINLDLPWASGGCSFYDKKYQFRNRFFEIPATGNFMLTLKCPEFLEIFGEDAVGYYENNVESFKQEANRYLKDKDLRLKKSKIAYNIVHQKHTFTHRFKEMFKILKKHEIGSWK